MKGSNQLKLYFMFGDSYAEGARASLVQGNYRVKHIQFHLLDCCSHQPVVQGRYFLMHQLCSAEPERLAPGQS